MNKNGYEKESLDNYEKFIAWLDIIREKNDHYFEITQEIIPIFSDFAKNSAHKETLFALLVFHLHLSTLKNALIDLGEEDNFYSIKALYRIFLEHWVKGTYIWARYISEKSNAVGIEYMGLGKIGEELKYGNSLKQVFAILDAETNNLDVWDALCKHDPKLNELNKKDITNNIKKFEYKNMLKYLVDSNFPIKGWVFPVISDYSELSSFVHGGPSTLNKSSTTLDNEKFEEYKGMIRFAFNMCRAFAYFVFVLLLENCEKDKKEHLLPLLYKLHEKDGMI